ncbi:MAG: putative metal-binding motif-containing protein [Sandaracinaceae bacterium]|nr:putative metal-binding motif-containing protein [Sandaracinaceae bacterium]
MACSAPDGYVLASGDCDDTRRSINPSAAEVCDGEDNDCDGVVDPGCPCVAGETRPCGAPDGAGGILIEGECAAGTQSCDSSGAWGTCEGDVRPVAESCNGADDDCDGSTDEGVTSRCWSDGDGDGYAPAGASLVEMCGSCPADTTTREPAGADVDCDDADRDAFPGQTSYFGAPRPSGGFDYDCDGAEEQRWTVRGRCADGPGSGSCGGGCALTEGFDARRPAPACGASERWVSGCSCSDDSCLESTPWSRTQGVSLRPRPGRGRSATRILRERSLDRGSLVGVRGRVGLTPRASRAGSACRSSPPPRRPAPE